MTQEDSKQPTSAGVESGQAARWGGRSAAEVLEARKTKANISMDEWLAFLDTAALSAGFRGRLAQDTGAECWEEYYQDGYTPREALAEDLSHAR